MQMLRVAMVPTRRNLTVSMASAPNVLQRIMATVLGLVRVSVLDSNTLQSRSRFLHTFVQSVSLIPPLIIDFSPSLPFARLTPSGPQNHKQAYYNQPNILPPPPPCLPPLLASFTNHSLKKSLFRISSGLVNRVSNCASCRLNASNVGILDICPIKHVSSAMSYKPPFTHPNTPTPTRSPTSLNITYPISHRQILNQRRIHLHLHEPQPSLRLTHPLLLNQPFNKRLHSLTCLAPACAPESYQRAVVGGGEQGESV